MHKPVPALLAGLFVLLAAACTNPMVEYLLREDGEAVVPGGEKEDTSPVAALLVSGEYVWYYSLRAAVDDAAGISATSPEDIYIRRDIARPLAMGAAGIELVSGKHIRLTPYPAETSLVTIRRWQAGTDLFTIRNGASLAIGDGIIVRGRGIAADARGVYVEAGGAFTMSGSARVADTDVYLENGAMITVTGLLGSNPAARITPEVYDSTIQVVGEITAGDIDGNNEKFDVTPEAPPPGWQSSRHWRVDNAGFLFPVVARRTVGGVFTYYPDTAGLSDAAALQTAFDVSYGSSGSLDEVTLLANIALKKADRIKVEQGHFTRLTVPSNTRYVISRVEGSSVDPADAPVFDIESGGIFEMGAPGVSRLVVDGGRQSGVESKAALVYVVGDSAAQGLFRLTGGGELRNNKRQIGDGAAVETSGGLVHIAGGLITGNVAASGSGGALFCGGNPTHPDRARHRISGGLITDNEASYSGGGVMLGYNSSVKLTMTGGEISGNKAYGIEIANVSPNMGYGGGIFIPANTVSPMTDRTTFDMQGGIIRDNISGSGLGHGVAMDHRSWDMPPVFTLGGTARIVNNDVNLHYYLTSLLVATEDCVITVTGFVPGHSPGPVEITIDDYAFVVPSIVAPLDPNPSCRVLIGSFNSAHFTAPSPHYIGSNGRLYP
jgi:hypothetical protein